MVEKNAIFRSAKPDISSLELTEKYIRLRAYERYEQRGRDPGHDLEDWFEAQSEIFGNRHNVMAGPHGRAEETTRIAA
jgi:hypothetical protein